MQSLLPGLIEVLNHTGLPVIPAYVTSQLSRLIDQRRDPLVRRPAGIEWDNQWLNDRDRPIICPGITPRFQVVSFGNVPVAVGARFIVIESHVDAEGSLPYCIDEVQVLAVLLIFEDGSVVDRICADNDEQIDPLSVEVSGQFANRRELVDGIGFDRISVDYRSICVTERNVDRIRDRVHVCWLMFTGNDDALSAVGSEVPGDRLNEFRGLI